MRELQAFLIYLISIILRLDISEAIEQFLLRKLVKSGEKKKLYQSNNMLHLPGIPNES